MTRLAKIKYNDVANGPGICVSIFVQGCHLHCNGCFNKETWDFSGGYSIPSNFFDDIIKKITANGIMRGINLLGGEPLCDENIPFIAKLITKVKEKFPQIKIYCWSGATLEQLENKARVDQDLRYVLNNINMLAAGPFILAERDITLPFVGSRNQKVYWKDNSGVWIK